VHAHQEHALVIFGAEDVIEYGGGFEEAATIELAVGIIKARRFEDNVR
jgi:hypothetical protein